MIGRIRRGHARRFELPIVEPVELAPQAVPMDPYALGLLLGDGCITATTTPAFATNDPELVDALRGAPPGHRSASSGRRRLRAPSSRRRPWRLASRQPGDDDAARAGTGRYAIRDEVRPRRLQAQLGLGATAAPPRPARHRRWTGDASRPVMPHPVLHHLTPAPRRRHLVGPVAGWSRLQHARATPRDGNLASPTAGRCPTTVTRTSWTFGCPRD